MRFVNRARVGSCAALVCSLLLLASSGFARNKVMGEVALQGASKVEKTSGVWVDGQYVGYLKELKGSKRVLLMPGEHEIVVRQAGYHDFVQRVSVAPGKKQRVRVAMARDTEMQYPKVTAEVKMTVYPANAAVFVDGLFIGHVSEFDGLKALLVAPGKRKITISLPGYQTFETDVDLAPHQVIKLMTNLVWTGNTASTSPSATLTGQQ